MLNTLNPCNIYCAKTYDNLDIIHVKIRPNTSKTEGPSTKHSPEYRLGICYSASITLFQTSYKNYNKKFYNFLLSSAPVKHISNLIVTQTNMQWTKKTNSSVNSNCIFQNDELLKFNFKKRNRIKLLNNLTLGKMQENWMMEQD